MILWTITELFLNREFQRGDWKNYHSLKIFVFLHGSLTWVVMQRNVWNDIVSWQKDDSTTLQQYLLHTSMTPLQRRRRNEICW